MVQTALEQSRRLAAEKMVLNVEDVDDVDDSTGKDDDDDDDDGGNNEAAADFNPEAFRIVEDALRRADEKEREDEDETKN